MLDMLSGSKSKEYLAYLACTQCLAVSVLLSVFVVRPLAWYCTSFDICTCTFATTAVLEEYCCGFGGHGN